MMRKILSVAVFACAMALAGSAGAGITVDLLWFDNGTATLSTDLGDSGSNSNCSGAFNTAVDARCLKVVWTIDEPIIIGSNSVRWDTSSGLVAQYASFFINYNAIGIGKSSLFLGFPNSSVGVNNFSGIAGLFTGAFNQTPPGDGVTGLSPGTYVVGTLVLGTSGVEVGSWLISAFEQVGLDGWLDLSNEFITDVTYNSAILNVIPEPGTASLLGLGLFGLIAASRRQRNG